jgi:hypothetical protein
MAKPAHRTYSRQNIEALELLAQMIRVGRIERKMSAQDMAGSKAPIRVARLDRSSKLPLSRESLFLEASPIGNTHSVPR